MKTPENKTNNQKFSGECYYCLKPGHRKSECRKRLYDERNKRNGNRRAGYDQQSPRLGQGNVNRCLNDRQSRDLNNLDHSRSSQRRHTYLIDAELDDENESEASVITISCENFSCNSVVSSNLTRLKAEIEISGLRMNTQFLVDSGSSCSFINPNKLPTAVRTLIDSFTQDENDNNVLNLRKTNLNIRSALASKKLTCAVGTAKLNINNWFKEHEFIYADIAEAGILGIDFLKNLRLNSILETTKLQLRTAARKST